MTSKERREHQWQPIETAPEDGSWIIVTDGYEMDILHSSPNSKLGSTHWMRGPKLPRKEDDIFNSFPPELPLLDEEELPNGWVSHDDEDGFVRPPYPLVDEVVEVRKHNGTLESDNASNISWDEVSMYRVIDIGTSAKVWFTQKDLDELAAKKESDSISAEKIPTLKECIYAEGDIYSESLARLRRDISAYLEKYMEPKKS